jgi:hypothetical protein
MASRGSKPIAFAASQAQRGFEEYVQEDKMVRFGSGPAVSIDYQSHYNVKIEKCLLLIEATHVVNGQAGTSVTLSDAYEHRVYAIYMWISRENKKYWEVPPFACDLIPTQRDERYCTSREEFDTFVANYME